jgi:hypothetical protein
MIHKNSHGDKNKPQYVGKINRSTFVQICNYVIGGCPVQ